jgi:hypothetical protein
MLCLYTACFPGLLAVSALQFLVCMLCVLQVEFLLIASMPTAHALLRISVAVHAGLHIVAAVLRGGVAVHAVHAVLHIVAAVLRGGVAVHAVLRHS